MAGISSHSFGNEVLTYEFFCISSLWFFLGANIFSFTTRVSNLFYGRGSYFYAELYPSRALHTEAINNPLGKKKKNPLDNKG